MKIINVGVVGVGYLGEFHTQKFASIPGVRLIGVADIDAERGRFVAEKFGTLFFPTHLELVNRADAVSIAVPTIDHFTVARDLLNARIDVFIEKPITRSLVEADELLRLAQKNNLLIQVGHLERFNPAVVALRNAITTPMFIESHRLSFFRERGVDVDVVLDLMIHDLDIILSLVNSEISSIHALGVPIMTQHPDIANARIMFENGCVANITASRISLKQMRKIRIFQPNAYLSVDYAKREFTRVTMVPGAPGVKRPQIVPELKVFADHDVLEDELAAFVEAVRNRSTPLVDGATGRRALKISLEVADQITQRLKEHPHFFESGYPVPQ